MMLFLAWLLVAIVIAALLLSVVRAMIGVD